MAAKNERLKHFLETYGVFLVSVIYMTMLSAGIVNLCMSVSLPVQFPEVFVNILRPWATGVTAWLSCYVIGSVTASLVVVNVNYGRAGRERLRACEFQTMITLQLLSVSRWTLQSIASPYLLLAACCYWHLYVCPCYLFSASTSNKFAMEDYTATLRGACYELTRCAILVTLFACFMQFAALTFTLSVEHFARIKAIKNA